MHLKRPRSFLTLLLGTGVSAWALPSHAQTPGWEVRALDISTGNGYQAVDTLPEAESFLNGTATTPIRVQDDRTIILDVIDIAGGVGTFPVNYPYPNGFSGDGQDDIMVHAMAEVTIPAGTWSIAMASDDGGQVTVQGVDFSTGNAGAESRFGEDATPVRLGTDSVRFEAPRGHTWTGGTFVLDAPLTTTVTATMFERGGGDSFEVAIRDASEAINNTVTSEEGSGWLLLGNGVLGWTVMNTAIPEVYVGGLDATRPQTVPPQFENEIFETAEVSPGLTQEWWQTGNPGSKEGVDAAFAARSPDVGPIKSDITWWTGSGTALEGIPAYPAAVALARDNYIVRLSGEILIPESGIYRFKDGVDDFFYLAIDTDKSGVAGDSEGEVLINDNNWTGVLGNDNGGSPIVSATIEVAEGGEWLPVVVNVAEGGGGDAGILYWDYDVNGAGIGAGVGFPTEGTAAIDVANAVALLVPETHLRSALEVRTSADLVTYLPNSGGVETGGSWNTAGGVGVVATHITGPEITAPEAGEVTITLNHRYFFEGDATTRWDGGQIQYSLNGGAFAAVPDTAFTQNGYATDVPITGTGILNGQFAFNGKSEGYDDRQFIQSIATYGPVAVGDTLVFRFVGAWDEGYVEPTTNWEISNFLVQQGEVVVADYDFSDGENAFVVTNEGAISGPWTYEAPLVEGLPLVMEIAVDVAPSNSWMAAGGEGIVASLLNSAPFTVTADGEVILTLNHRYFFEGDTTTRWDGGQVRVSVNGGAYEMVPDTAFTQNGYATDIPITGNNILTGQFAFNGKSAGYDDGTTVESTATLGTFTAGDQIAVQFAAGWDEGYFEPTTNWEVSGVAVSNVEGSTDLSDFGASNIGTVWGPWTFGDGTDSDTILTSGNPDPTVFTSILDLNDAALEVKLLSGTPVPGDRFQLLGREGSLFLLDFAASGPNANGVPDGWHAVNNLVQDVPHMIADASGLASPVTITALDDGFNPNNTDAPGIDAVYDGITVPVEANNDYLFKIADAAGTSARMEIANLNPGVYNVTLFEGRTSDTGQFGKIWSSSETAPETENTGSFANGGATVTVTIGEGDSLFYEHLEDGSGGISGMIIREIPTMIVGEFRSLVLPEGQWDVSGLLAGGDGSLALTSDDASGWAVRGLDLDGTSGFEAIDTLIEAETFLANTGTANIRVQDDRTVFREVIDIAGGAGSYTINDPYPNGFSGEGQDDITVQAVANVTIPAGTWTIAFASDDGGGIKVEGVDFSTGNAGAESRFGEDAAPIRPTNDVVRFEGTRGHTWTGGTFVLAEPLTTTITVTMFERGGGDSFEVSLRNASEGIDNTGFGLGWELLMNGTHGWMVTAPSDTQPAIHMAGMGRIADQIMNYSLENEVLGEGEVTEGLSQEWWGISNPGAKATIDSAFASRLPDFGPFKADLTWWTGSGTAIEGFPAYPEGIPYVDSYIARLTGEILIPESGTYRFKDGVDDFIYLAIDSNKSGVAGDIAEEILINDNTWTGVLGNDNGGSPISTATFEVAEGGEWLAIVVNIGEGGGGDAGILYWDYDVNGGGLGAGVGFPAAQVDAVDVANAGALLIPESHLRSTLIPTLGGDLVASLETTLPVIFEVDGETGTSDRAIINNPNAEAYTSIIDVTGAALVVRVTGTLAEGAVLDLFGGATIRGVYASIALPEGDWDLSGLAPGGDGKIVFGEEIIDPEPDHAFDVISVSHISGETEDSVMLTWQSEVGHTYAIESSLTGEEWADLEVVIEGEEGTTSYTVEGVDAEAPIGLYRVLDLGAPEE